MKPFAAGLTEQEFTTFLATVKFLNKRLTEQATIDWALGLKPAQQIERIAIRELLNAADGRVLDEPWATAWQLIEESWSINGLEGESSKAIYGIATRLCAGERSGTIVAAIVQLVAPRLEVKPIDNWRWQFVKKPRRPKTFDHLLSASLTSGDLVDLSVLQLTALSELPFLTALANALEAAITHGLDIARRLGWDGQQWSWQLGELTRAYYETTGSREAGVSNHDNDPDAHFDGIAPAVKLLHAVVARLAELEPNVALQFVRRWRLGGAPVNVRLWAAIARNPALVSPEDVSSFLRELDDREFWDLHSFPEIAELRAVRFDDLDQDTRKVIVKRLRKGPPRNHWPRKENKENSEAVKVGQLYCAVRELKRITVVAKGALSANDQSWLDEKIVQFGDLARMTTVKHGFLGTFKFTPALPDPDSGYDFLKGDARLQALETALSSQRGGFHDDPAKYADNWLRQPEKAPLILGDLKAARNTGDAYPRVWQHFGWAYSPKQSEMDDAPRRDLQGEADRVFHLLQDLSVETLSAAIKGISHWIGEWHVQVLASPSGLHVWLKIWPIAIEATNAEKPNEVSVELSVFTRDDDAYEPTDLGAFNSSAGKLIDVFLSSCPSLNQKSTPFSADTIERQMRDVLFDATGRSELIVRYRLIERLPYFLRADRNWAQENLIIPLLRDDDASLALWRAIAQRTHSTDVLKIIGGAMTVKATDRRLSRKIRRRLVFSVVRESLFAFHEKRDPVVPNSDIQQLLRTLDDEVRASAANAILQIVTGLLEEGKQNDTQRSAELFRSITVPFFRDVWPQERSLVTAGVSNALASLPAMSGDAFAEAVETIERFLVPFQCWSMVNYGFHEGNSNKKTLALINDEIKAKSFLRLLDLTIGSPDSAIIPRDLTDALERLQTCAPGLAESPALRRLSTAARR